MNFGFSGKILFFLGLLLMFGRINYLYSQSAAGDDEFFEHVRFGGSLGLGIGDGYFSANLAPKAIYDFNRYTAAGVGFLGAYANGSDYTAIVYGGSLIGFLRPWPAFQLSAEFEELHVSRKFELDGGNRTTEYWYPALFLGIGYTTGPVTFGLRYDILYDDKKSIYENAFMPFVSIYF